MAASHVGAYADAAAFGVHPDGGDASGALQDAIDRLAETGGILLLAPGRYRISGVELARGVTIKGAGPVTRLVGDGATPVISASNTALTGLADLTVEAPPLPDGAPALRFSVVERLQLDGIHVQGGGRGLDLTRVAGSVRNSVISDAADAGLFSIDATGLEVAHNLVQGCGNNGIQIWRSVPGYDGTLVTANRIRAIRADAGGSGQNGNGINIFRAGNVNASNNIIDDCAYSALRSNGGSDCVFSANTCSRLGEVAIYAEFGFEGALISANLIDNAATGISITNFNEGGRLAVCSGNLIRNLHTRDHFDVRGTGIGAEADTLVTGNVVEGAPVSGISLGYGRYLRNVMATNNILRNCRWGVSVSVVDGAGPAVISGNMFAGATEVAVQGLRFDDADGGDLADGDDSRHRHLTISSNIRTSG